jgi:Ice-binding-like
MKATLLLTAMRNGVKRIPVGLVIALAMTLLRQDAMANPEVNLGTANDFAVLAGSAINFTGPNTISGDIGSYPTPAVTGLAGVTFVSGANETSDTSLMLAAKNNLTTAYNTAAGLTPTQVITTGNLGGLTLTPGVYSFSSAAQLTGTLTLNDEGNPDAVFVFQIGSSLTTATGSSVVTINGGSSPGTSVFWQVGSSATLGTSTAFEGNILADQSITLNSDATVLDGRLLAENGAVTLDDNTITAPPAEKITGGGSSVPDHGNTLLLLGAGLVALFAFGRRFSL